MSVWISMFGDTSWTVMHDEAGHEGTIQATDLILGELLRITCPVCLTTSDHPLEGGSHPDSVAEVMRRLQGIK